jgi:hypothetical protein
MQYDVEPARVALMMCQLKFGESDPRVLGWDVLGWDVVIPPTWKSWMSKAFLVKSLKDSGVVVMEGCFGCSGALPRSSNVWQHNMLSKCWTQQVIVT